MKPKTMILLGVAILCGLGASYATMQLLAERQAPEPEKIKLLVARKALSAGDPIKIPEEMFEEKDVIKTMAPEGVLDNIGTLKGRVMRHSRQVGDWVRADDLFGEKDSIGIIGMLSDGYRAIGIRVNAEDIAAGFASLPLSRVDILSTVRRGDDKSTYSMVLLEDVLILAADAETRRNDTGQAMMASVVTLAVKSDDAMKLRLAGQMGALSLVVRKMNDTSRAEKRLWTYEEVKNGVNAFQPPVVEVKKPSEEPAPKFVEVKTAAPVEPQGTRHILSIREGDTPARTTEFLLNSKLEVITQLEVTRTELTAAPPRVQQAPAAPPQATPAETKFGTPPPIKMGEPPPEFFQPPWARDLNK